MTPEDQAEAKALMLKHRRNGADKKDCAIFAGIDRKTLYRWFDEDATFATQFKTAWREYKMGLIVLQRRKDPWKLLTNDFGDRFKEVKPIPQLQQNNLFVLSDEQLAKYLHRLLVNIRGGSSSTEEHEFGGETTALPASDQGGNQEV